MTMLDLPPDAIEEIMAFLEKSRMGSQATGFVREAIASAVPRIIEALPGLLNRSR